MVREVIGVELIHVVCVGCDAHALVDHLHGVRDEDELVGHLLHT